MTTPATSRAFVLARRPHGFVREDDFELVTRELEPVDEGGIMVETLAVSLDPAMRGWLDDRPSYLPPVALGAPVRALGLARVLASRHERFTVGDVVRGTVGWQERQVVARPGRSWERIDPRLGVPLEAYLGVLGMTGLTAWVGHGILEPQPGHTVLVSGASGAVGSVAVQLAKRAGARVVGIAGGAEKCELLTDRLGADVAVDRHAPDWHRQLRTAVPDGIDRVFENSGGPMFDATLTLLNDHARIALCGLIDGYNAEEPPPGPRAFPLLLTKRVLLQGFIVLDHVDQAAEAEETLGTLLAAGELVTPQTVVRGFENLAHAFVGSFTDGHVGKLVVDVS